MRNINLGHILLDWHVIKIELVRIWFNCDL
jgi:hypothetical protein